MYPIPVHSLIFSLELSRLDVNPRVLMRTQAGMLSAWASSQDRAVAQPLTKTQLAFLWNTLDEVLYSKGLTQFTHFVSHIDIMGRPVLSHIHVQDKTGELGKTQGLQLLQQALTIQVFCASHSVASGDNFLRATVCPAVSESSTETEQATMNMNSAIENLKRFRGFVDDHGYLAMRMNVAFVRFN